MLLGMEPTTFTEMIPKRADSLFGGKAPQHVPCGGHGDRQSFGSGPPLPDGLLPLIPG